MDAKILHLKYIEWCKATGRVAKNYSNLVLFMEILKKKGELDDA